ncbi:hypothetical protein L1P06_03875 [Edwardsiella piscicida]|uniref:hypothetical protein n=1 Tax=Edwardsiella piscicida TaxID=1263550 RepID=UPI001F2C03D6|nr:hypothetical protein [Edwardsiella piscicida]UJT79725.1 hypothetical protein L1P06_03875 [Edwardsiella piscicida]
MNIAKYVKDGFMFVRINKELLHKVGVISYGDYVAWHSHQPNAFVTLYPVYNDQPPRIIKASRINEIQPQAYEVHKNARFYLGNRNAPTEAEA